MKRTSENPMKKPSHFKGRVMANLDKHPPDQKVIESEEAKKKRQEAYKSKYDKLRHWSPSKQANMKTFCSLPKELFQEGTLSLPALAVYPVLCADADFKNESWNQLSLENIKKKTGLSIPIISKAIEELCRTSYNLVMDDNTHINKLLQRQKHTEGQRTYWIYKPWFIREKLIELCKGQQFFFYTYLIESSIWRNLDRRAKALYLIMRSTSVFDFLNYCDAEDISYQEFSSEIIYRDRKWEECNVPLVQLCKMIGMSSSHISTIIDQLIKYNLLEKIPDGYIVFQLPSEIHEYFTNSD